MRLCDIPSVHPLVARNTFHLATKAGESISSRSARVKKACGIKPLVAPPAILYITAPKPFCGRKRGR
jgi:hypothetical protein